MHRSRPIGRCLTSRGSSARGHSSIDRIRFRAAAFPRELRLTGQIEKRCQFSHVYVSHQVASYKVIQHQVGVLCRSVFLTVRGTWMPWLASVFIFPPSNA